ncbi:rhomboid family intramembrane serine protease [Microbulbifer sp. 2201CG32-9]|uniref:rhomboid family intramembrane serine protease n=1 Tax=Microbulbifer sp. 2201CG32-9 TaxID=3232309 RepID=UPI00345B82BF
MLTTPAHYRSGRPGLPLVCAALIALNLLVFVFYQSGDEKRWQKAEDYYFSSELPLLEEQRFLIYVNERHPEWRSQLDAQGQDFVYRELMANREFHRWLLPQLQAEGEAEWLGARREFATLRDRLSSFALGLVPSDPGISPWLAHMFLHGSWDHLIGNMIFLLLFGLSVELALGHLRFLALYLFGGLAAAGLHLVADAGSPMPMVGASGAVSAVMGACVAIYGLARLHALGRSGSLLGKFSAPALLILPLWLAKELFGYFYGDAGVAYWAHAGGLLAGFVLALLMLYRRPQAGATEAAADPSTI